MPPARKSIQKQAAKPAAKNLNRAGAAKGKGKARAPPVPEPEPEPEPESDPDPSDDDDDDFEIGDAEEEEDEEDEVSDVASEDPEYPDDLSSVYTSPPPPRSPDQVARAHSSAPACILRLSLVLCQNSYSPCLAPAPQLTEKQLLVELVKATNTNNDLLKGVVVALSTTTPNTAPPSAAAQPRSREPDSASFILTPSKDSLGRFRDPAFVKVSVAACPRAPPPSARSSTRATRFSQHARARSPDCAALPTRRDLLICLRHRLRHCVATASAASLNTCVPLPYSEQARSTIASTRWASTRTSRRG